MAIRSAVLISPKLIIIIIAISLLWTQSVTAQQCLNNNIVKRSDGSQQTLPRTACNLNQATSGHNFTPTQHSMHQMNFQQPSNIQQASFMQQASNIPQWSLQQVSSQPTINSISNSQIPQQQNQNHAPNLFSALQNIQPIQGTYMAQINAVQQPSTQSMNPSSNKSVPLTNKSQHGSNQAESSRYQITYSGKACHNPSCTLHQQNNIPPSLNPPTNTKNAEQSDHNQPGHISGIIQQTKPAQNQMIIVPGPQANTAPSQPIILTLQAPPLPVQSQPIIYAVQTPSFLNQNQQVVRKQANGSNNAHAEDQSLINSVMSQIQNEFGNDNPIASILPAIINSKSEKSSLKALLPLILNMMNERTHGCGCPHCGCNNNKQPFQEPDISSGYSNKKVYSSQEPNHEDMIEKTDSAPKIIGSTNDTESHSKFRTDDFVDVSEEEEEEDEDEEDDLEEYDEEE